MKKFLTTLIFLQFQYFHNYKLFYNFVCLVWCSHYDTSISDRCNILDMGKLGDNNMKDTMSHTFENMLRDMGVDDGLQVMELDNVLQVVRVDDRLQGVEVHDGAQVVG